MGIGYFQLTVINENDKYLIGNPQFTFFKSVYKRHTNFAKENVYLNFVGDTNISESSTFNKNLYTIIPKNGDLVHKMYISVECESTISTSKLFNNMTNSAFALIDYIEVAIGDQVIDRHTGEWLHIYNELFNSEDTNRGLVKMIDILSNTKQPSTSLYNNQTDGLVYIPLSFWFNKYPGLSLPLLALQYVDLKISVKLNNKNKILNDPKQINTTKINKIQLLTEFIHLDSEEKLLFASKPHEYLIEQVQYGEQQHIEKKDDYTDPVKYNNYQHKFELHFNHPVKEIFWVIQDEQNASASNNNSTFNKFPRGNHLYNFWRDLDDSNRFNQLIDATISLNGNDIFEPLHMNFFDSIQKYQYHSGFGYPDFILDSDAAVFNSQIEGVTKKQYKLNLSKGSGIYCYSFALNPEEYQPSGTLNFSKLDRAELKLRINSYDSSNSLKTTSQKYLRTYALNYNVLTITSGSAGLLFQN